MKTIYLLRHAKSDWGDPGVKDRDRPLNARGREAAPAMEAYTKAKQYAPDLVLCSTARRTIETLELVKPVLGTAVAIKFEERLYLAEPAQLMERLQRIEDAISSVMFIGHNPGIAQFAIGLSAAPENEEQENLHRRMREKFSTCALAVVTTAVKSWRDVRAGRGMLVDFMRPKDL